MSFNAAYLSNFLQMGNYFVLNKQLVKYFDDMVPAIVFSYFVEKRNYFFKSGLLKQFDTPFYLEMRRVAEELCISISSVSRYVDMLQKKGWLSIQRIGIPRQNFYVIDDDKFFEDFMPFFVSEIDKEHTINETFIRERFQQKDWSTVIEFVRQLNR